MKKLPYEKINFKELIYQDCYYVDKTKYLEEGKSQIEKYILDKRIDKDALRKYVIVFANDEYTLEEV